MKQKSKKQKRKLSKETKDTLWSLFLFLACLAGTFFVFLLILGRISNNLCDDKSTCYAVSVFIIGIIVTLKIKVLDSKSDYHTFWLRPLKSISLVKTTIIENNLFRRKELIGFILGSIFNGLVIFIAFWKDCLGENESVLLLLNVLICLDFVILLRNIIIVISMYYFELVKRTTKKNNQIDDIFVTWLNDEGSSLIKRALTDKSYRNIDNTLDNSQTNTELATFGDSLIKYCLCEILLDNVGNISEEKKKFESDKFFVTVVAKKYNLLDKILKDEKTKPNDYEYVGTKSKNNPHKYIATALEAMVGAIYKETGNMKEIKELIDSWRNF